MQVLDFTLENGAIIGDSFGPVPVQFNRSGFDFAGSVIKFEVYKKSASDLKFNKTLILDTSPGQVKFDMYLTPAETAAINGNYKYRIRINWPNSTDVNTIYGGIIEFKQQP